MHILFLKQKKQYGEELFFVPYKGMESYPYPQGRASSCGRNGTEVRQKGRKGQNVTKTGEMSRKWDIKTQTGHLNFSPLYRMTSSGKGGGDGS